MRLKSITEIHNKRGDGDPSHSASASLENGRGITFLTFDALDEKKALAFVGHSSAGASVLFVGTTRDNFQGKEVVKLEYEAYSQLAIKTLRRIIDLAAHASGPWPLSQPLSHFSLPESETTDDVDEAKTNGTGQGARRVYVAHRLGNVPVGQASILVAVSSPHRREAFEVAEWVLEIVKREVQIWKKEVYRDGDNDKTSGGSQWKSNVADAIAKVKQDHS